MLKKSWFLETKKDEGQHFTMIIDIETQIKYLNLVQPFELHLLNALLLYVVAAIMVVFVLRNNICIFNSCRLWIIFHSTVFNFAVNIMPSVTVCMTPIDKTFEGSEWV